MKDLDTGSSISLFPRAFTRSKGSSISHDLPTRRTGDLLYLTPTAFLVSLQDRLYPHTSHSPHTSVLRKPSASTQSSTSANAASLIPRYELRPHSQIIPTEEIIHAVEPTLRRRDKTVADDVRMQMSETLRRAKPAKPNYSKEELSALRDLKRDSSIHILTADKGNATIIMDRSQYTAKVSDILSSNSYCPLKNNPIPSIEKRVASKLLALHRADALTIQLCRYISPSSSPCPRFFGQPKIHKPDVPLRPIVASRDSPTYNTARYLAKILRPVAGLTQHHVSNSGQFVEITRNLSLQPSDILVSFDVVSHLHQCLNYRDMPPGEGETRTRPIPWWPHITLPWPNTWPATDLCFF